MWIVSIPVLILIISLLTSSRARLIYYRLKDDSVEWISERVYVIGGQRAGREVRIVCLGDSMTDDMPEQPLVNRVLVCRPTWIQMLQSKLRETCPNQRIFVFNYGARSTRIAAALERMTNPYKREDSYHETWVAQPSVKEMKPNIVILESHAYMDQDTKYEEYAQTVRQILFLATKEMGAQIYFLATICPDATDYKKPYELYINNPQKRINEAQLIRSRMEDFIALGKTLGVPTIDVYHETTMSPKQFIKGQDMVHPSYMGHILIAQKGFEAIRKSSAFNLENIVKQ